jgi:hypothetical protein
MNRMNRHVSLLCAAMLAIACTMTAHAGPRREPPPVGAHTPATTLPNWEQLSQAQREAILSVVRERWNANPEQRARMLQNAERWQRMTPEQRRSAQHGQRRWEHMSPEERKAARAAFEQHLGLSPQQRESMRETLKAMTPEQRREWMQAHRRQQDQKPGL